MKLKTLKQISAFGGINFVFEHLEKIGFNKLLKQELPILANQCTYDWPDIINSLFSIFFCGGDCIEDLGTNFRNQLHNNPFIKIPSPDRVLDRLKELSIDSFECKTKRGKAIHTFTL